MAIKLNRHLRILSILSIFLLFRLLYLSKLQYWSDDEQLLWSIVRHIIIDKHLSLVTPNAALGIGLGPLFHYLIAPWFWLVKLDPQKVLLLGNFFAFGSVILFYKTGKLFGGRKIGFIAALLYSASFMSALFDRRLWALSPNVLLLLVGIFCLIKITKGSEKYIIPLSIPIAFSLNSDPSLGVITLASLATLIFIKPKIKIKYILFSTALLLIMLSPILIFQIRHGLQSPKVPSPKASANNNFAISQLENFSRFFYATKTDAADAYFCYCTLDEKRPILITIVTAIILIYFIFSSIRLKNRKYLILILTLFSYLFGIFVFAVFLNGSPSFFYTVTISPVLFLISAIVLSKLNKYILAVFLCVYIITNFYTLSQSNFKYPLKDKMNLVKNTIKNIPNKNNFSLYYSGDILLAGGGWTALFESQGYIPERGNLSLYWGHVYSSYQLYPIEFTNNDPETVVILSEKDGHAISAIYNNQKHKFNYKVDLEQLYQPKYFK